jgi:hypothetical protein
MDFIRAAIYCRTPLKSQALVFAERAMRQLPDIAAEYSCTKLVSVCLTAIGVYQELGMLNRTEEVSDKEVEDTDDVDRADVITE